MISDAGDREAPLHAARQRLDEVLAPLRRAGRTRAAPVARSRCLGVGQVEVAAVDEQVLAHGQLGVEVVLLRHDAEPGADLRAVRRPGPCRGRVSSPPERGDTPPIMRIVEVLPAPFGPRKPNASPGATSKSMPSTATKSPNLLVSRGHGSAARGSSGLGIDGIVSDPSRMPPMRARCFAASPCARLAAIVHNVTTNEGFRQSRLRRPRSCRACRCRGRRPSKRAERIAEAQDIPIKFLETILLELKHAGIVRSQRGAEGGYALARPAAEIIARGRHPRGRRAAGQRPRRSAGERHLQGRRRAA